MTAKGLLLAALRRWTSTYSVSGEVPLYPLSLDGEGSQVDVVPLYETPAGDLERLLLLDGVARGGFRIERDEDGTDLTVAALRVRHLLREHRFAPVLAPERPHDAVRLVAALSRLQREIPKALESAANYVRQGQAFGATSINEKPPDTTPLEQNLRDVAVEMSADADAAAKMLDALEAKLIAGMPSASAKPSTDGLTLLRDLCVICTVRDYPETFHVRVFSPSTGPRIAIVGDLTDNLITSVFTRSATVVRTIQEAIDQWLDGSEEWLPYLPQDYSSFAFKHVDVDGFEDSDMWRGLPATPGGHLFRLPFIDEPLDRTVMNVPLEDGDDLVDGRIKRWHAVNCTAHMVIANGAKVVDYASRRSFERFSARRSKHASPASARPAPPRLVAKCTRWFCAAVYAVGVDNLPESSCPRCGNRKMVPLQYADGLSQASA